MGKLKIIIAELGYPSYDPERRVLAALDAEVVLESCLTEEALLAVCRDADAILVRTAAPVTRGVIAALDRCKVISRYGIGVDNVDVAAATEHGIMVCNVPDYGVEEVSDQAVALLLACGRRISSRDRAVRRGAWDIGAREPIYRIAGKALGLVGYGRIARVVHRKLTGFRFGRTVVFDPLVDEGAISAARAEKVDLPTLCSQSDFISIHAPLNDTTRHMIGAKELALMKPTTVLVNTSRGGLVDTEALVEALRGGTIRTAGIDVYEQEPPPKDHPLFSLDNAVLSDHVSWYSEESQLELQEKAAGNVVEALTGRTPRNLLNSEVLKKQGAT
ncbi:MAG: C-terminal binding protein [Planctomycetota bacterium]